MLASYFARNYAMYAFANHYQSANLVVPNIGFPTLSQPQLQEKQHNPRRTFLNKCKMNLQYGDAGPNQSQRRHGDTDDANVSSEIKFSIDRILSRTDNKGDKHNYKTEPNTIYDTEEMGSDNEDDVKSETINVSDESLNYSWMQCTRYKPPKLQRMRKKDGGKKRKLGRNPRVPFTQHQVATLEQKFCYTHYLSSMDVVELSTALSLTETRVKIWFQNRRARERRDRDTKQRGCQDLGQPRGQQNMYQSTASGSGASWGLSTQPTSSLTQLHEALKVGSPAFTPVSYIQT